MINYITIENKKKSSILSIDPRTKIAIMVLGNIAIAINGNYKVEIILMSLYLLFGFLCGAYKSPIKIISIYFLLLVFQCVFVKYLNGTLTLMLVTFTKFINMILPCALLASIMIFSTKANEFMAALTKMRISKKIIIPLTVMIRYFPSIKQDWKIIKDAMRMRDITPSFLGFLKNPSDTIECIYVPMLMAASKVSDELSKAAITRAIENPKKRTCIVFMKMKFGDYLCISIITFVILVEILMK